MTSPSPPKDTPFHSEDQALARHRDALRQQFPMPELPEKKSRKALGIALGLTIAAALLGWADPAYRTDHYATTLGKQLQISLPDGSRVTLDSNTQVTVSQHPRSRRVALLHGQALFDVRKNTGRPFRVDAGMLKIEVLGTLFDVRRLDQARVTLLRGAVDVSDAGQSRRLKLSPGQQLSTTNGTLGNPVQVDAKAALAWQDHQVIFANTPLPEALAMIRQYRHGNILLDDPRSHVLTLTGVFDTRDLDKLLNLLPGILPVTLRTASNGDIHISLAKAEK